MSELFDDVPPRVVPHPRIRQRRVEVKRDEGRRRLRFLVGSLAAIAALGVAYGATRSPLFDVDTVHVRGSVHTSLDDVLRASGLRAKPPLSDVDEARLAAKIERLPWVEDAVVRRRWPGTVDVTVTERIPLTASQVAPGQWAVLDPTGRVLSIEADPGDLTKIETPPWAATPGAPSPASVRAAIHVVEALPEILAGRVPTVRVGEGGSLQLLLDNKVPVDMGPPTDVEAKLVAVTTLVEKADLRRVSHVDVRVPTAPVLTRG